MILRKRGSNLPADDLIRLQVYLARCGVASRRASEKLISDGRVSVNGAVVTETGTKVSLGDTVCVDMKKVELETRKVYVLLNKPAGFVCTSSDEAGRSSALDLIKDSFPERLYNVGRLDMFSEGALIFTNDGDFAAKLSHPSAEIEKEYVVDSAEPLPRRLAENFKKGVRVDGVFYRAKDASEMNSHRMRVVLVEGKNREIRKVFEDSGVTIRRLTRVRIGIVGLGELKPGEFRTLSDFEVRQLLGMCKGRSE